MERPRSSHARHRFASSALAASPGSTSSGPTSRRRTCWPSASAGIPSTSRTSSPSASGRRSTTTRTTATSSSSSTSLSTTRRSQRLNAAELDAFIGPDYLVTIPNRELLPVTRLFARCENDEALREQLFAKGTGRLLYEVLDDLFDYCFPILDKIGHKLDSIEDDMFEGYAEDVVRDISNVEAGDHLVPQGHQARPLDPAGARASGRQVPARGARSLLRRHRRRRRADLGSARQLQGGRRRPRVDERVRHLASAERRPSRSHDLQRDPASSHPDLGHFRHERRVPRRRHDAVAFWIVIVLMLASIVGMFGFFRLKRWL